VTNGETPPLLGASVGPQEVRSDIEMNNILNTPDIWVIAFVPSAIDAGISACLPLTRAQLTTFKGNESRLSQHATLGVLPGDQK
jgi:hypothetical protein